jgi:hypothetical protein
MYWGAVRRNPPSKSKVFVTRGLKPRTVEPEEMAVARVWLYKHFSTATESLDSSNS